MSESPTRDPQAPRGWRISAGDVLPAVVLVACLLDAVRPLGRGLFVSLWLDVAALSCLAWALLSRRSWHGWSAWSTPFDGRIVAALALATLQALPALPPGAGQSGSGGLAQLFACGVCFYALTIRLRGQEALSEGMWRVFALGCLLLGLHALLAATNGLARLRVEAAEADVEWAARHGLAKAILFTTVLTAGRAAEPGAGAGWRVTALIGVVGCLLHAAAGGFGLDPQALGRLDEPLYFSATAVLLLMLFGLVRRAWEQRRSRPQEARRWRSLAGGFLLLAVFGLFGETTGGEGVRVLAVLAAVTVLAVGAPCAASEEQFALEDDEPAARRAA